MAYYHRDRIESVSGALAELRFAEMQQLASNLTRIAIDRELVGKGFDAQKLAHLLSDWSQSMEDEIAASEQAEEE